MLHGVCEDNSRNTHGVCDLATLMVFMKISCFRAASWLVTLGLVDVLVISTCDLSFINTHGVYEDLLYTLI